MMKFLHTLMNDTDAVVALPMDEETGTYADGLFHLTKESASAQRPERKRFSYGRDHRVASLFAERPPVLG